MNQVIKLFRILFAATVLAVFALPSSAAPPQSSDKTFSQWMEPKSPDILPPNRVTAKFTNQGNSSFKALTLTAPTGWLITKLDDTPVIASYANPTFTPVVIPVGGVQAVNINGINLPQGAGKSITFGLTVKATTGGLCSDGNIPGTWPQAVLWTGSTVASGSTFKLSTDAALNSFVTTVDSKCIFTVTGVASPAGGGKVACESPVFSGGSSICTSTADDSTGTANSGFFLTNFSPNCSRIDTSNQCRVNNVLANTTVTGYFLASTGSIGCAKNDLVLGTNNYDSALGPTNFEYDPDGSLIPLDVDFENNITPGQGWGVRRGINYRASECKLVASQFAPATSVNGSPYVGSFLYDRTTGQAASWKYRFTWPVTAAGAPPPQLWVSWGIDNPSAAAGSTDFVPSQFCLTDPGDLTQRTIPQLEALRPLLPDDCDKSVPVDVTKHGPFCKAANAHPTVYVLGEPALVCLSQQGVATGGENKRFGWFELVDQADAFMSSR